jgi:hypothetical protein
VGVLNTVRPNGAGQEAQPAPTTPSLSSSQPRRSFGRVRHVLGTSESARQGARADGFALGDRDERGADDPRVTAKRPHDLAGAEVDRIASVGVGVQIVADCLGGPDLFARQDMQPLSAVGSVHGQAVGRVVSPGRDAEAGRDRTGDGGCDGTRLPGADVDRSEAILTP